MCVRVLHRIQLRHGAHDHVAERLRVRVCVCVYLRVLEVSSLPSVSVGQAVQVRVNSPP